MNNEELNASIASLLKQDEPPAPPAEVPSAEPSMVEYFRNRDALVQLKERESSLPSSYGDSMGWVLYCLWAIPISAIMMIGGPIIGPSIAIFVIIYIIKGWLEDGEKLVKEEEEARFGKKKRKKVFYRINEKGETVEEDSP
jgi:hypothetical protein